MSIKHHIPNLFTLGNVLCGCFAIVFALQQTPHLAAFMIGIAAVLDFLDGFAARLLHVQSELGKQLDSLADMVTFGIAPAMIAFVLVRYGHPIIGIHNQATFDTIATNTWLHYIPFLIAAFSALRLAKFNIDTRQSDAFIGLPTPANALFWASIPLILAYPSHYEPLNAFDDSLLFHLELFFIQWLGHPYVLIVASVLFSLLMVANIPLFSLKFKNFTYRDNKVRFLFLGIALITIIAGLLIKIYFISIPIIILLYLIISIVDNLINKHDEIQS